MRDLPILVVSLILAAEAAFAQSDQGLKSVGPGYREFIAPTQVSGHAIVGLTTLPVAEAQRQDILYVYFKNKFNGSIRLEVSTADGLLRGEGEFSGVVAEDTWAKLSIKINRDERTRSARESGGPETLAVSARLDRSDTPLVVHWGQERPTAGRPAVRLYVNSRRADLSVRVRPTGPLERCRSISGMTAVRFDKVCDIAADQLPKDGKVTLVRRDGFETEAVHLLIGLPN
jgi:hypothetical protein